MCVCWFVCFLSATRDFLLCGAASESESRSRRGRPRASGQACTARARAHAVQLTSQRKNRTGSADAFQKQNRTRAHAVVYVAAEIFKKREKKPKCHFPSSVYSLPSRFSWSVYFSNRTESYSSQIEFAGPHGITENQATYLHCGEEARVKKRARPPATCRKASTGKTGADTGPEGCGSPAVFPSPCLDLQRLQS